MATSNTTDVELTGEVRAADARQRLFRLWLDDGTCIPIDLDEQDEADVCTHAANRDSFMLHIKGTAEVDSDGHPVRVTEVTWRKFYFEPCGTAQSFFDDLNARAAQAPEDSKHGLPKDGAVNHDHYIYGTPKRHP
jgi:hypothetical protein